MVKIREIISLIIALSLTFLLLSVKKVYLIPVDDFFGINGYNSKQVKTIPWYQVTEEMRTLKYEDVYFWESPQNYKLYRYVFDPLGLKKIPEFNEDKLSNITIGGTVVLARGVRNVIDNKGDVNYPWQGIAPLFQTADLGIVNFKSPLVYEYIKPTSKWELRGKARYITGVVNSGIDLVSLSGNHMGDGGIQGIKDTIDIFNKAGIKHTGLGYKKAAYAPVTMNVNGNLIIGFLAYNSVSGSVGPATNDTMGMSWLIKSEIKKALDSLKNKVDFIIVMPNWGQEYISVPDKFQISWGHYFINNGADLVVGDQAHWVQEVEFYKGKFISYGLGNLIFDQTWSQETREGIIERYFFYGKELVAIDLIPVYLNDNGYVEVTKNPKIIKSIFSKMLVKR